MNRIGPSASELYIANVDGTAERKLFATSGFDYHASYSVDGKWIVFTSERNGNGQADLYRVHSDGTGLHSGRLDQAGRIFAGSLSETCEGNVGETRWNQRAGTYIRRTKRRISELFV